MAHTPIGRCDVEGDAGDVCRMILDLLPSWFGIPEANDAYVQTAGTHPSVIASINGDDVGITTIKHHSPYAAEVHLIAVKPSFHRAGIGTAMLRHLEDMLAAQGVEFLQHLRHLQPAQACPARRDRRAHTVLTLRSPR